MMFIKVGTNVGINNGFSPDPSWTKHLLLLYIYYPPKISKDFQNYSVLHFQFHTFLLLNFERHLLIQQELQYYTRCGFN